MHKITTDIHVAAAIILKSNQVLIAERPREKHKGGYWEFPGGKIEAGESAVEALQREILEELNLAISRAEFFEKIEFTYPEKSVTLEFFLVEDFSGEAKGMEGQQIRWVALKDIHQYQFPEANQVIVEKLLSGLKE